MTPSYALTVIVLQGWWLTSGSNSMRLPMRLASTPKDTQSLKQDELVKTRQITKSEAGVVTGTVHAIATGGLTVLHPIYAGRAGDSAKLKLDIIQTELMKRGVPLHQRDEADNDAVEGGMDFGVPETISSPLPSISLLAKFLRIQWPSGPTSYHHKYVKG